jgi:DNA repair protein RecN (Recombination protein N)
MLASLRVVNLAIIDRVEVDFRSGFNVLTGETGAGKSILIGALDLLLGARSNPDLIRTGEEEALVEGCFEIPAGFEPGIELDASKAETREIILSRRITRSGRSKCLINGSYASLSMLQTVGGRLVSIFGQHEQRILLDSQEHLDILDTFGGLLEDRNLVQGLYAAWKSAEKDVVSAENRLKELERQNAENEATIEELTKAALKENEEDELLSERDVLKKAVQIREKAFEAHQMLYSKSGSLMEGLSDVRKLVEYLAGANPKLQPIRENFEEAVYRIEDAAMELRDVAETSKANPKRLEAIEDRLALIRKLKKKYSRNVPELIEFLAGLNGEAGDLFSAKASLKNCRIRQAQLRDEYLGAAQNLGAKRREAATDFHTAMNSELHELSMPDAVFQVKIENLAEEKAGPLGLDVAEFLLSSNAGEEPRPMAKIASGGELSRIMLAIKALQVEENPGVTVIFDEVDSGIGGHTAYAVGSRLGRVAAKQQVLCITHLHQVAAFANHHLAVRKSVYRGRTRIKVNALNYEQRLDELARMLGAPPESESAREHIRKLMGGQGAEA